jgi:internalin A
VWLVPQALPDNQPKEVAVFGQATEATRLRYTYQALPEGLVPRAIVRLHEFIETKAVKKLQWASGAILTREGARALLRTEPQDRLVMLTVTGPKKARQQLAGLCQAEMRDIHRDIPGLNPTEETQFKGAWVPVAALESDERNRQQTGVVTQKGTVLANPREANDEYSEQPARQEEVWKPVVFISYSKANAAQRRALETQLKILMNEGLVHRVWHDRMIDPGDEWDPKIRRELGGADVVIFLTSAAALATDYITQHELPQALQMRQEQKTEVVPIILEDCRWEPTSLGKLLALPEKGRPISGYGRPATAWNAVAGGLATVFKKLIERRGREDSPKRAKPRPKGT